MEKRSLFVGIFSLIVSVCSSILFILFLVKHDFNPVQDAFDNTFITLEEYLTTGNDILGEFIWSCWSHFTSDKS